MRTPGRTIAPTPRSQWSSITTGPSSTGELRDRNVAACLAVKRGDDPNSRANSHAGADVDSAGAVEERLLPDPSLVANAHGVVVVALENCLVPHIYVRAELDVLWVKDEHARFEDAVGSAACKLVNAKRTIAVTAVSHRSEVSRRGRQGCKLRLDRAHRVGQLSEVAREPLRPGGFGNPRRIMKIARGVPEGRRRVVEGRGPDRALDARRHRRKSVFVETLEPRHPGDERRNGGARKALRVQVVSAVEG